MKPFTRDQFECCNNTDCPVQWVGSVSSVCPEGKDVLQACYLEVSGVTDVWPECNPNQQEIYPGSRMGPRPTQCVFVRVCKGKDPGPAIKAY
jgi:hypothetical protein